MKQHAKILVDLIDSLWRGRSRIPADGQPRDFVIETWTRQMQASAYPAWAWTEAVRLCYQHPDWSSKAPTVIEVAEALPHLIKQHSLPAHLKKMLRDHFEQHQRDYDAQCERERLAHDHLQEETA